MSSTTSSPYPILAHLSLKGPRGIVGRNKERLKDIPTERTGIGLVLDVDGVVHEVEDGTPLRRAHGIGSASAVLLVDLRRRRIKVDVTLPSAEPHHDFSATAVFHCKVRSATAVVQEQVDDLAVELASWTTNILRRRSRDIDPERTADLEAAGRTVLASATSRSPVVPPTTMAVTLASFEVHVSEDQRKLLNEAEARRREANRRRLLVQAEHDRQQLAAELAHERAMREDLLAQEAIPTKTERALKENELKARTRIDELNWDELVDEQAGRVEAQREDQQWDRRRRSADKYEEALGRGPEAVMALLLAEDPGRVAEVLGHQLQSKAALHHLLIEVTRSPHIDGSVLEPYAKQLADLVGKELKVGPGFAPPEALDEGSSWGADEEWDDPSVDDRADRVVDDDPFDPDSVITAEVVESDVASAPDADDGAAAAAEDRPPEAAEPTPATADPVADEPKGDSP